MKDHDTRVAVGLMLLVRAVCDVAAFDYNEKIDRRDHAGWAARVLQNHFPLGIVNLGNFVARRRESKKQKKRSAGRALHEQRRLDKFKQMRKKSRSL